MSKELIQLENKNGVAVVSSRVVAKDFGKRHAHVLRAIKDKIEVNPKLGSPKYFIESTYVDKSNRKSVEYLMTRDGFTFIVMGFTGEKADEFKLKYIEAFNKMEEMIKSQMVVQLDSYMIADPLERARKWIEEEQERQRLALENKKLEEDNKHKEEVIEGITETLDKPTLRSRINQIVKYGTKSGYQGRYRLLYSEFEKTYHMNLKMRLASAIDKGYLKKSANRMDLICDYLDMTQELYEATVRVFEGDFRKLGLDIVVYTQREQLQ